MFDSIQSPFDRPFRATPDIRYYYPFASMETARESVVRAIIRAEGPVLVIGGAGYGKSLLAELVAEQLYERLDIVKLQSAQLCSRRALLQNILFELRLPYRALSEGELRLSILDRMEPSPETAPEGLLIVVDEAHTLHWKLLDELRLISNFTRCNQPRARLLLLGNLRLEDTFASPQLASFNQRLAVRCYLQPMNRSETIDFIRHQFGLAGLDCQALITHDALQAVYAASQGIPRLVNQVMDHALVLAAAQSQSPISAALINEAWADLQQLPTPWSTGKADVPTGNSSSIEFGTLDDESYLDDSSTSIEPLAEESAKTEISSLESGSAGEPPMGNSLDAESHASTDDVGQSAATECSPTGQGETSEQVNYFSAFQFDQPQSPREVATEPHDHPDCRGRELGTQTPLSAEAASAGGSEIGGPTEDSAYLPHQPGPWGLADDPAQDPDEPERIELLNAEQQQYDAMSIWENDPPLYGSQPSHASGSSRSSVDGPQSESPLRPPAEIDLFGCDYDDEIVVPTRCDPSDAVDEEGASCHRQPSRPLELADDCLARIQLTTAELAQVNDRQLLTEPTAATPSLGSQPTTDSCLTTLQTHAWSMDIAPVQDGPTQIESAIADIVSQLNFSAFLVEPFSVEQIPLKVGEIPRPADEFLAAEAAAPVNARQVRGLHEVGLLGDDYDDDRDLLIIEEHLPIANRLLDESATLLPSRKPTPYAQLFAKLRK